jgi:hypothetical protein
MSEINVLAPTLVASLGLATSVALLVRTVMFAARNAPAS